MANSNFKQQNHDTGLQAPLISDYFQDSPLARWPSSAGTWQVDDTQVDIYASDVRDIYRCPEEPGWLEWLTPWQEKDGTIKASFNQITGNPALSPSYSPWYRRFAEKSRPPQTWQQFIQKHEMLPGSEDAVSTTHLDRIVLRTRDGGETWEDCSSQLPPEYLEMLKRDGSEGGERLILDQPITPAILRFIAAYGGGLINSSGVVIRCKDGRLVSTSSNRESEEGSLCRITESLDDGKTWSDTQFISPEGADPEIIRGACDENALVELGDGRILLVFRVDASIHALGLPSEGTCGPCQAYLTRIGPGQYEASPPAVTPMPHSGNPELLRCADGVIWYWGTDGHWYTVDDGQTWRPASIPFTSYYGRMLATGPSQLVCLTQYLIHDSPYPYSLDSSIRQYRFSYRRSGILQQNDAGASLALASRSNDKFTDLHIHADLRIDGANGIAFRIQSDGRSYYVFAVVLPDSEAYKLWFPPEVEAQKLAIPHVGEEEDRQIATGGPMCVLGRVDSGQLKVLSATKLLTETDEFVMEDLRPGDWLRMQVKVCGDLIQAAAQKQKEHPATYVGARDARYTSGGVGLVTDKSTGAFKNVYLWDRALMIRDLWQ